MARSFEDFAAPIEQTARFCGMVWEPPFAVLGTKELGDDTLRDCAARLRQRIAVSLAAAAGEAS